MTWILILNWYASSYGIAVTNVNGFKSVNECVVAGKTWRNSIENEYDKGNSFYTCIYQSK